MKVNIRSSSNNIPLFEINLESSDNVRSIKNFIHETVGIDPERQRLIFSGVELNDLKSLEECEVKDNSLVRLLNIILL